MPSKRTRRVPGGVGGASEKVNSAWGQDIVAIDSLDDDTERHDAVMSFEDIDEAD